MVPFLCSLSRAEFAWLISNGLLTLSFPFYYVTSTGSYTDDECSSQLIPHSIKLYSKLKPHTYETTYDKPAEAHLLYEDKGRKANLVQSFHELVGVEEEFQIHTS